VALLALAAASSSAFGADSTPAAQQSSGRAAIAYYGGEIARFRKQTWHWERVMGVPLTPRTLRTLAGLTPSAAELAAEAWRHVSDRAYAAAQHPPHLRQFLCIHHFEGNWRDTGGPYYGGLQMDRSFQASYGGWLYRLKGTADHWSPLEQIWTAEKALKSRGFWPWPNTARYCRLL
jgi:Transglycosylase-like domain